MRKIIFLLTIFSISINFSMAQTSKYAKDWQNVDTLLIKKSLSKSALKLVNDIYAKAKKADETDEVIKALMYKFNLEEITTENEVNNNIAITNNEIATTKNVVAKSLLQALKVQQIIEFKNNNSWRIRQRNETENYQKNDILTWSANDFNENIYTLFDSIFIASNALKQTNLNSYSAIIIKGNTPDLRLTLYDMLLHYKLNYYKNNNDLSIRPENEFLLNKTEYFSPAEEFVKLKINDNDVLSFKRIATKTYQEILDFYLLKKSTSALADADIQRIQWIYENSVLGNKDTLYTQSLRHILQKYASNKYAKSAAYLLANYYNSQAEKYEPYKDTSNRWKKITALEIIDKYAAEKDTSENAVADLLNLKENILSQTLSTKTENINVAQKPMRALVSYKNISEIFVRIIKTNFNKKEDFYNNAKFWKDITGNKNIVQSFSQKLPLPKDFQEHSTEIKIDGLPTGRYILLASSNEDFDLKNKLSAQLFDVSDLAYLKNENEYFVLNRETGQPISGATIHFLIDGNNSKTNYQTIITDNNGKATALVSSDRYTNFSGYITYNKDRLDFDAGYYYRYNNQEKIIGNNETIEKQKANITFFTDRSIYRPGQKVFFKGIATTIDAETMKKKLYQKQEKITVFLNDVNNKKIDSITLQLNDYASFSGSFKIPESVLTGNFSIDAGGINGSNYFKVEEYKRPTFSVEFDTLKTDYRLNDSITVTGFAKTFSGTAVDNATVSINVTRSATFPYFWYYRSFVPSSPDAQIANEIIKTDENGKFSFTFKAIPDANIDKASKPIFNFEIDATITDNNGETRKNDTYVRIGYQSLLLNILNSELNEKNDFNKINIETTNLSNQKISANVSVKIYALQSPERLIRQRFWERPDQFVMDKSTYISLFPNDEYDNELDKNEWKKEDLIYEKTANSNDKNLFVLNEKLPQGWYIIEAKTQDKDGNEILNKKIINVYDENSNKLSTPQYLSSYTLKSARNIGDKDIFKIGTSAHNVHVLTATQTTYPQYANKTNYSSFILNDAIKTIEKTTTEKDLYPSKTAYAFIKNNRFFTSNNSIKVTDATKNLTIDFATFRDKTEPGSKEKWQIKIKDNEGSNVAAELLSAMYDASLDEFTPHNWHTTFDLIDIPNPRVYFTTDYRQFRQSNAIENYPNRKFYSNKEKIYSEFIFNQNQLMKISGATRGRMFSSVAASAPIVYDKAYTTVQEEAMYGNDASTKKRELNSITIYGSKNIDQDSLRANADSSLVEEQNIPIRTNFNETAFFMPHIYADKEGLYTIDFTMPDALTKWRWMNFAYTKSLQNGYDEKEIITQKTLMVQPNMPRFFRAGDTIDLSVKITNMSEKNLIGESVISLEDAITGEAIHWQKINNQQFDVNAGRSTSIKFPMIIPANATHPLTVKITGKSENFSDGEQHTIPVLTNKIFVTEALPMFVQGDTTQHFTFDKLINNKSTTLETQALTVEFTANPVWYAVQALPYLIEYPYECSEQNFNRFYANALATHIVNQHPRIKNVFNQWLEDSTALVSNLEKNQELKQILLEETPWVLEAENETQQKKNIALLFDLVKMNNRLESSLNKLKEMQMSSGGFSWFKGGKEDRYITQYILAGMGRLLQLNAVNETQKVTLQSMANNAQKYLSAELSNDFTKLKRDVKPAELSKNHLNNLQINYLFANSYFNALPKTEAEKYYYNQAKTYWNQQSSYSKGMITAILYRANDKSFAQNNVLKSLLENAVEDKEKGTYWKDMNYGYYWYQAPIEQQSLMIEITNDIASKENNTTLKNAVNGMQNWLIRNKQTNNWKTTKATADACFALINVNNLLNTQKTVRINLGNEIKLSTENGQNETGYLKETILGNKVDNKMGNITVVTSSSPHNSFDNSPAYGSVYWQYVEEMEKVTFAKTPLALTKQLFIENNTSQGKKLTPVNYGDKLSVGDKVVIRLVLKSDRDMEYLHLKDMRASSMELTNVLSSYKWQDGLGYYEATKDASTNFFISYLPKGTYVFDYPVYITNTGDFSVGVASIQCMYAPEFVSHSDGIRIKVK